MTTPGDRVRVVLFTGGRGSGVLSRELLKNERIALTLAVNGYDDGLSTGEIRRFLPDCLGPSDFRKNASRLATELRTCDERLIALLDFRLPDPCAAADARRILELTGSSIPPPEDETGRRVLQLTGGIDPVLRSAVGSRFRLVQAELDRTGFPFAFADCSLGNLVFAGCFLHCGRRFNPAVEDYCSLLGLPAGLIQNVTGGENAWLVALDRNGRLVASEAEIVNTDRPHDLKDIFLLDHSPAATDRERLNAGPALELQRYLASHQVTPAANPELLRRLAEADLIVYAPGTQHSSLFPSYLTPGLGAAVARNLHAVKVLITNLQEDAEIFGSSAVDLITRAQYYLREKNRVNIPTPCLITHFLINEPGHPETSTPYVPLGRLESLEDPRLVRIGNYEDGVSGRHDASRVLTPFIKSFLRRGERPRVAVALLGGGSLNKVGQSIVEIIRAGVEDLPVVPTVFYEAAESFDAGFESSLPFGLHNLASLGATTDAALDRIAQDRTYEYLVLFESSGMYRGDDVVALLNHLPGGRIDAVWGSRRLSVNDIRQAYRLLYRHRSLKAALSYVGSHLLSLACLMLYGRYISDTLSGVRAVRTSWLRSLPGIWSHREFNHVLLARLLRRRAEILEIPVYYFPISPEKVHRTTVGEGLRSLLAIIRGRWGGLRPEPADSGADVRSALEDYEPGTVTLPK